MPFFDLDNFIKTTITKRPESLLTEDLKQYHHQLKALVDGSSVLVIGGAGTIGSNFIKALLQFLPKKVVVVDLSENGLTELVREVRSSNEFNIPEEFITYPFSYGSSVFYKFLDEHPPFDIIANFAAHKHVRSEKDPYAIQAMIENNVLHTNKLLHKLLNKPPKRFFCVSTDKAANPVNVMGATKKLMEEVILAYKEKLHVTTARFANVAFSNGSLLDSYLYRIAKRQPLPAPEDIYRYFVSPKEAGQLCLLACLMGETGDVIFPKLDPEKDTMSFAKIATAFLDTLGLEPLKCQTEKSAIQEASQWGISKKNYPVYYFQTNTTGEKTLEEFYTNEEQIDWEKFNELAVIKNAKSINMKNLDHIESDFSNIFAKTSVSKNDIIALLQRYLPNFNHFETGMNLDQKM